MRPQTLMVAMLALIFGGSAALGVSLWQSQSGSAPKVETVSVVMSAVELYRGGLVTPDVITMKEYPKDMVPEGALTSADDALGRSVGVPMVKGEPILDAKLSAKGAGRGLAAFIPKGMRAVTIRVTNVATGVAGLIMPGNRVDVLWTMTDMVGSDPNGGSTKTLLQNVEILAVDQRVDTPLDNKLDGSKDLRSVTLLVTPLQANQLDLGQNKGTLQLALRNRDDQTDDKVQPATIEEMRIRTAKPLDERIRSIFETIMKAVTQKQASVPAAPALSNPAGPYVTPVNPIQIRTLRGSIRDSTVPIVDSPSSGD